MKNCKFVFAQGTWTTWIITNYKQMDKDVEEFKIRPDSDEI